jgi:hypothetical protein
VKRYRDITGLELLEPPGEVGVKEAVEDLFRSLCLTEQKRRMRQALIENCTAEATLQTIERERKIEAEVQEHRKKMPAK